MTEITNVTQKVYSSDGKLWANMTRLDAYNLGNEHLELFNFADKNNDQVLEGWEITRYSSPVIVENYEEVNNSRIITNGKIDAKGFLFDSDVKLSTKIITSTEEEFYAGLKLEQVTKKGTEIFAAMDIDRNGELSPEEIEQVAEIKNKINETLEIVVKEFGKNSKKGWKTCGYTGGAFATVGFGAGFLAECSLGGATVGGLAGAVVGLLVGFIAGCVVENSGNNKTFGILEKTFQNTMGDLMSHPYAKYALEALKKAVLEILPGQE